MKRLLSWLLAAMLLCMLLPVIGQAEEITYTGVVNTKSLHLRKEPSASAKVIDTYSRGKEVTVLENDGTWCKVQVGKKTVGYMMTQYLDIKPSYSHIGWGKTQDDGTVLNLRSGAGPGASVVYKTMSGAAVEIVEEQDAWYRVRLENKFGWVEKRQVTLITGDYSPGYTTEDHSEEYTAARMASAIRDFGSATTVSRLEGDFTYSISYPVTGIATADERIRTWTQETLKTFEADYNKFHQGTAGASYTVEYQAISLDSRYKSVLLFGEYRVKEWTCETLLALNLDTSSEQILNNQDIFSADPMRAQFCLDGLAEKLMSQPTDGYVLNPDASWLKYAVLGRDGVQLFLPKGLYTPLGMGTRFILMRYNLIGECMGFDSETIRSNIRKIDPSKPMIALTFDDGPSDETDRILKVLADYDQRATFCVIGNKVESYAGVLKRTIAGGNEIASHTWSHRRLTELSAAGIRSQLEKTNEIVAQVTGGYQIKVLRPPYGKFNKTLRSVCAEMGLVIAEWEIDTLDWNNRNVNKTYNNIMKGARDGVIILCHDLYETTATAVERAIPDLVDKGFQLVTVSELLSFHKDGAQPGVVYARVDPENKITGEGNE
ncbi:MAG: polysaccharide deacetylase family protein [Clostridia bacterium]|nr:polysaccharide deacetylase family protein [Clostridia bacterium]